jgi:hypothetical protein
VGGFVNLQVSTSSSEAVAQALERLTARMQTIYPGWQPSTNDILTIAIEALGPLWADTGSIAATVAEAVFRRFGTKLENVPYNEGARASVSALFTTSTVGPHTIPQGLQVTIANTGFYVEKEVEVEAGKTTAKVRLVAESFGSEYNDLSGVAEAVEAIDWLKEITLEGETGGGSDQETDTEYQERLAAELALQAPRPVNAGDFAPFLLGVPETVAGIKVGRAVSKDLYDASTSESGVAFCTSSWVTGPEGEALTSEQLTKIEEWLKSYLAANFIAPVKSPVYEAIHVKYKIHPLEDYSGAAVVASVNTAIESLISKKNWGRQQGATTGSQQWVLETLLRYNTVLGAIAQPSLGVAYVFDGATGLAIGTSASPTETLDITLSGGPVVLPYATGATIEGSYE